MTQKQLELQKLISMEQKREKEFSKKELMELLTPTQTTSYPLSETMKSLEKELNLDIFSDDKDLKKQEKKEKKKYSSTKVKARNFLTNISYNGIKSKDYENRTFVIDIFAYLILYFNPYNINGKFESDLERSYINILWSQLLPQNFYIFVAKKENIQLLSKKNAKFQDAVEIIKLFIENADKENTTQEEQYNILKFYLTKYIKMYQFIFANLFPKYYSKFNGRGIENNIEFTSYYSNYLNQNNIIEWQKNNQFWEEQPKNIQNDLSDNSESDVEIIDIKKVKKEDEEDKKKQKRLERKREMLKQKKVLEEKLAENTEKLNKTRKYKK